MSIHFHSLPVKEIKRETRDCVTLVFEVPEMLKSFYKFIPGQSVSIRLVINGEDVRGTYFISGSPLDKDLKITVKKIQGGILSTYLNEELRPWQTVEFTSPIGKFYTELSAANQKNYLAICSDTGIIPVQSIMKATFARETGSRFTLLYEVPDAGSIIFFEELEALKNKFMTRLKIIYITQSGRNQDSLFSGPISAEKLASLPEELICFTDFDDLFLCCEEEVLSSIKQWLVTKGISTYKIHHDISNKPENKTVTKDIVNKKIDSGQKSKVTIIVDGRNIEFELGADEDSILDAALNYGLTIPYACKAGMCNTCKAKLLEGKVEMKATYALDDAEIEQGYILTCQSHPITETIVVNYDENL